MKTTGIARAHTNIALIKYWGKKDKALFLPMNSSLSLTLEAFYTDTKITLDETLEKDEFYLNHVLQQEAETQKISKFCRIEYLKGGNMTSTRVGVFSWKIKKIKRVSQRNSFLCIKWCNRQDSNL